MSRAPQKHRSPQLFKPKLSSPCLCGSGLKFKNCCRKRLPGFDIGDKGREAIKAGNLKKALMAYRADVTQYTIWHKSHTEPALLKGIPEIEPLLKIDIKALGAHVDNLFGVYLRSGRQEEFSVALEFLRGNINDPRWQRRITYFHVLNSLGLNWDRDAGKNEFQKLGAITSSEDDLEILQLYIDLYGRELSFSERIEIIDRILMLSNSISNRLQYQGGKAVEYLLVGDTKKGEQELAEAIQYALEEKNIDELTSYEKLMYSQCLKHLAFVRHDQILFQEAIEVLNALLEENYWTPEGRIDLYARLGECCRHAGQWPDVKSAYEKALAIAKSPICEVFLSETLLHLDKPREARDLISRVNTDDLDLYEFADFVFAFAAIAIETGELTDLKKAKGLLENLKVSAPYFNDRRLKLLVNVQSTIESGRSDSIVKKTRALLANMASSVSKYIILQPNFMGLGINLNSIVEDIAKTEHHEAMSSEEESVR